MRQTKVKTVTDKEEVISLENLDPYFDNEVFEFPQTIYLDPEFETVRRFRYSERVEEAQYRSAEQLSGCYGNKYEAAEGDAKLKEEENTPAYFEVFLRILLKSPNLRLVHIISGYDGGGISYRYYGFIEEE